MRFIYNKALSLKVHWLHVRGKKAKLMKNIIKGEVKVQSSYFPDTWS